MKFYKFIGFFSSLKKAYDKIKNIELLFFYEFYPEENFLIYPS